MLFLALHYSFGLPVLLINTLSVFTAKVQSWELMPKMEFLSCEFATFKTEMILSKTAAQ